MEPDELVSSSGKFSKKQYAKYVKHTDDKKIAKRKYSKHFKYEDGEYEDTYIKK